MKKLKYIIHQYAGNKNEDRTVEHVGKDAEVLQKRLKEQMPLDLKGNYCGHYPKMKVTILEWQE